MTITVVHTASRGLVHSIESVIKHAGRVSAVVRPLGRQLTSCAYVTGYLSELSACIVMKWVPRLAPQAGVFDCMAWTRAG